MVEYPPWLSTTLQVLMVTGVIMFWVFPVPAGVLSIVYPVDGMVDSGGKGTLARLFLQALLFFAAVPFVLGPNAWQAWERSFRFAVLALVMAWGVAAALSVDRFDSSWTWMELFSSVVFMLLARQVAMSPRGFDRVVLLALGVGWALALLALWRQAWLGNPQEAVVGTFYQADVAAGYFLLLLPVGLGLFLGHGLAAFLGLDRGPLWALHGTLFMILLATMILTYSRGAALASAAVITVMVLVSVLLMGDVVRLRGRSVTWAVLLTLLGVTLTVAGAVLVAGFLGNGGGGGLVPQKVAQRASELVGRNDTSVTSRLDFWRGAVKMAVARPFFGWGPSSFGRIYPRYQGDVRFYSRYTHSQYLTFLAEGGFVTLGAFLALVVVLAVLLRRRVLEAVSAAKVALSQRSCDADDVVRVFVILGLVGGLAAGLLHLVVDVDWEFPVVRSWWFGLAGVALAAGAGVPAVPGPSSLGWRFAGAVLLLLLIAAQPRPWAAGLAEQGAQAARDAHDPGGAVAAMREAVRWMPGSSLYRRELSECLVAQGMSGGGGAGGSVSEGVAEARKAVHLDPERAVNHEALGNALLAAGDSEGAARAYRSAIAKDPVNYPGFYNVLATLEGQAGRLPLALATLQVPAAMYAGDIFTHMWGFRQQSLRSQLTQTWLSMGRFQQQQGRTVDAMASYTRAVELDGTNIGARFNLGLLLMERGDPGAAYVHFCDILGRKPLSPISMWLVGISCREMGQEARAAVLLEEAYRLKPDLRRVGEAGASLQIPPEFFHSGQKVPESHRLEPRG